MRIGHALWKIATDSSYFYTYVVDRGTGRSWPWCKLLIRESAI